MGNAAVELLHSFSRNVRRIRGRAVGQSFRASAKKMFKKISERFRCVEPNISLKNGFGWTKKSAFYCILSEPRHAERCRFNPKKSFSPNSCSDHFSALPGIAQEDLPHTFSGRRRSFCGPARTAAIYLRGLSIGYFKVEYLQNYAKFRGAC